MSNPGDRDQQKWRLTREKILMAAGLLIIVAEFISSEIFSAPFRYEWLLCGLALCGVSITQWGDRR